MTIIVDNQVLVYVRGRLIMKRWLKTGVSCLFHSDGWTSWSGETGRMRSLGEVVT